MEEKMKMFVRRVQTRAKFVHLISVFTCFRINRTQQDLTQVLTACVILCEDKDDEQLCISELDRKRGFSTQS
jgi:intergrase/recombinase